MTDSTGRGSYSAGLTRYQLLQVPQRGLQRHAAYPLEINPHSPIKYNEFDHSQILTTYLEGL